MILCTKKIELSFGMQEMLCFYFDIKLGKNLKILLKEQKLLVKCLEM